MLLNAALERHESSVWVKMAPMDGIAHAHHPDPVPSPLFCHSGVDTCALRALAHFLLDFLQLLPNLPRTAQMLLCPQTNGNAGCSFFIPGHCRLMLDPLEGRALGPLLSHWNQGWPALASFQQHKAPRRGWKVHGLMQPQLGSYLTRCGLLRTLQTNAHTNRNPGELWRRWILSHFF